MIESSKTKNSATLTWKRHESYESARKEKGIIYLFEWNDKPFYWGIAKKSAFGTRYNVGYRHLIEGTLRHNGKLYVATVTKDNDLPLSEIENYLIVTHGHEMNSRIKKNPDPLKLNHKGDRPVCLTPDEKKEPNLVEQSSVSPQRKRSFTHSRQKPFEYIITPYSLIIYRGKNLKTVTELDGEKLIRLLDFIEQKYGNDWFPLDNSKKPTNVREFGLGTAIEKVLKKDRDFCTVASQLAVLLHDASIFSRRIRKGRVNGGKYSLKAQPESWTELKERMENIDNEPSPDDTHLTQAA